MEKIIAILEENDGTTNDEYKITNVKEYIMECLEKSKKGMDPTREQLCTVRTNIEKGDHHDLVRVDQIITRMYNKREIEYQWGSIVLGLKMKLY